MVGTKRRHDDDDVQDATPRKLRATIVDEIGSENDTSDAAQTPSRRGKSQLLAENGTPRSILKKSGLANAVDTTTPRSSRKLVFHTPTKSPKHETPNATPTLVRNADRSARKKSNRRLFERTLNGIESDEDILDEEETLAEEILGENEEEDAVQIVVDAPPPEQTAPLPPPPPPPETPVKRGRGRPKGSGKGKAGRPRKDRSPTPTELPSHEEYFWQNRLGGTKTSDNTLSAQTLLNHDEYFQTMHSYEHRHQLEMDFLEDLHSRAFDQWMFELSQGFNICLYGYGSKRTVTEKLTQRLYAHLLDRPPYKGTKKTPKIVVINGYTAGTTLKDILTTIASTCVPSNMKMPNQLNSLLDCLLGYLTSNPPAHPIPVVLNSIDSLYIRRAPIPSMLARVAAHASINLICTADTPNFPLLWDVGLKTQYKFLFHDATTFAPYTAELDVVESVNELLGRSGRRIGGRDGVGFVLRSLPEHARHLFRLLVMEQLALSYVDEAEQAEDVDLQATLRSKKGPASAPKPVVPESSQGVEYRVLYHKAVGEFICTSEVAFRSLLKEFHDHQMVESNKDAMGTERLWVPFRLEELEGLAEDLAGDML